jgi:hypothetical protein
MKRTGYDANTRQYTFHDSTTGVQYISAPGERYGTLLPAATANYVNPKLGPGRKQTLQAYDRPVFFADDNAQAARSASRTPSRSHKGAPNSPSSRSPTHSSSTHRRHGHRHTRSATFADILPANLIDSAPPSEPKQTPPRSPPKSAAADEKGHFRLPHFTDEKGIEPVERHYPGDKKGTRDALRTTVRVLGRSFTAVRGHRSHGQRSDHDGYVLV